MDTAHTIIIAEIGVNHGGDIELAGRMVKAAAEAGADYAKFQTYRAENLVCRDAERARYQKENCGGDESQLEMLRRYQLDSEQFRQLAGICRSYGIGFLSSAFDLESVELLSHMDMDYWKIPSGEITNLPYLRRIAAVARRVILSTGMSTLEEVRRAVEVFEEGGVDRKNIILLHCTTQYPTPYASVNLRAMDSLRQLGCGAVGYSDHTPGITVPIAAVARGAAVIEKHFTVDKTLSGPDHKASLEPAEFAAMVRAIRDTEEALGSGEKQAAEAELGNRDVARKSLVASRHISKGELFSPENLTAKRPGTGLSPMLWDDVIGRPAPRDFESDEQIYFN